LATSLRVSRAAAGLGAGIIPYGAVGLAAFAPPPGSSLCDHRVARDADAGNLDRKSLGFIQTGGVRQWPTQAGVPVAMTSPREAGEARHEFDDLRNRLDQEIEGECCASCGPAANRPCGATPRPAIRRRCASPNRAPRFRGMHFPSLRYPCGISAVSRSRPVSQSYHTCLPSIVRHADGAVIA
jgi:hypothetical protein